MLKFTCLMSSAAHRFGCVEFWILNIKYLLLISAGRHRIKISIQNLTCPRMIQMDELLRTLVNYTSRKYVQHDLIENDIKYWKNNCKVAKSSLLIRMNQLKIRILIWVLKFRYSEKATKIGKKSPHSPISDVITIMKDQKLA